MPRSLSVEKRKAEQPRRSEIDQFGVGGLPLEIHIHIYIYIYMFVVLLIHACWESRMDVCRSHFYHGGPGDVKIKPLTNCLHWLDALHWEHIV